MWVYPCLLYAGLTCIWLYAYFTRITLHHNDDVITEKFKDIFPDPNIEATLIAMDNFVAMQTKAKQLVQIYKPAHDSPMASAAILVHYNR